MKKSFSLFTLAFSVVSLLFSFGTIETTSAGSLPSGIYPNIDNAACTTPVASGGWGGECKFRAVPMSDGCTFGGKFVGVCGGVYSSGSDGCCIPSTSTATGPIASYSIPADTCTKPVTEGGKGGACKVRATPGSNGCNDTTESFVGLCRTVASSNADGCCVPKGSAGDTTVIPGVGGVSGPTIGNYTLLEQIPGSSNTVGRLDTYLEDIYRFAFWTVGIAVVFMLTVGGFMYLTSAGNTSRMENAKTVIFDAILGLVLALVAWLFLYVINPDLVDIKLPTAAITPVASTPPTPPSTPTKLTAAQCAAAGGAYANHESFCPTINPSYFKIGDYVNASGEVSGVCCAGATPPGASGTSQALAQQIKNGVPGLSLSASGSCSSAAGAISPTYSIQQAASGSSVTACQKDCPGTGLCSRNTSLSPSMLQGLIKVAAQYPMTVTSLTGGDHSATSTHYSGRGVDVVPTAPKSQWPTILSAFRAAGSTGAICDKDGNNVDCGTANHIHAQW